jgi:hypothetical protein
MQNKFKLSLLIFLASFLYNAANAQFINKIKNAAERGVTKAIERKVENEVEKVARKKLNKAFEGISGPEGNIPPGIDLENILNSMSADVEIADAYYFTGFITLEVSGTDEKGKPIPQVQLKNYLSESPGTTAMEFEDKENKLGSNTVIIYDMDRQASILLIDSDGEKSSLTYNNNLKDSSASIDPDSEENEKENLSIRKTGKVKVIQGYECEEYSVETPEGEAIYWITKEPLTGFGGFWHEANPFLGYENNSSQSQVFQTSSKGNIFELDYKSKTDKVSLNMSAIAVDEKAAKSFLMNNYPNIMKPNNPSP